MKWSQFLWDRNSGVLSWFVLAQDLSGVCNQHVICGCHHLKTWLGLEDSLSRWHIPMAIGKRPQYLVTWKFTLGCSVSTWHVLMMGNLRARDLREKNKEASTTRYLCSTSHTVISALFVRSDSQGPAHTEGNN